MGLREELQKRIDKKSMEIFEAEHRLSQDRAYLQGMIDTLKFIPPSAESLSGNGTKTTMPRHGSDVAKARDAILKAGTHLHVTDILTAIGKPVTKSARTGLSGSLSAYVRDGKIFTRPLPNTFGLIELERAEPQPEEVIIERQEADKEKAAGNVSHQPPTH